MNIIYNQYTNTNNNNNNITTMYNPINSEIESVVGCCGLMESDAHKFTQFVGTTRPERAKKITLATTDW